MKKALLLVGILLISCLAFVTCTADDNGAVAEGDIIELRVLNYIDLSGAGAMEELEFIWQTFEDANPHIRIIREDEFEESFHHAKAAYAAANDLPDVLYVWPSGRSASLHTERMLLDLEPLIRRDGLDRYLMPAVLDPSGQAGGYLAMIPQGITATHTFIANLDILSRVGLQPATTFSELVDQAPVLRAAGYETIIMPNMSTWVMQSCLFSMIAGRFMGPDWDVRILNGETTFEDPAFIAALEFVQQLYETGVIDQSSLAIDYGEGPGLFATERGAYYIDGDWRIGAFITDSVTGQALIDPAAQEHFHIGVFPEIDLPGVQVPARTNSVVLGVGWAINANLAGDEDKLEAAWTLVQWLIGEEVQSFRLRTGGLPNPSWMGIDYSELDLEPLQVSLASLGGQFDVASPVIDGSFDGIVYGPLNEGLQAIGMGISTPAEIAAIVQAAFESWLALQP